MNTDDKHSIIEVREKLPYDQSWIKLQPIRSKSWIFKELDELLDVPLQVDIGQVRHHVGHHLEKVLTITRGILDAP